MYNVTKFKELCENHFGLIYNYEVTEYIDNYEPDKPEYPTYTTTKYLKFNTKNELYDWLHKNPNITKYNILTVEVI